MIIKSLSLVNIGPFQGAHTIKLEPRMKYGQKRPIVLFGGLNGAGKTTILDSIRLALYGKNTFGKNTSQSEYEQQLREMIHNNSDMLIKPNSASISLEFEYAMLGKVSNYRIEREWVATNNKVKDSLRIVHDDNELKEVTYDQAQSFLNELVPIGVSDLFFFDGEKIRQLARDEGNVALGDAIKRLLGLDLIERLRSDLGIYLQRYKVANAAGAIAAELKLYEEKYREFENQYDKRISELGEIENQIVSHENKMKSHESEFAARGGAWSKDRDIYKTKYHELEKERKELQDALRNELADTYPLSLVPELLFELESQLRNENLLKQWKAAQTVILDRADMFISEMHKELSGKSLRDVRLAAESAFPCLFNLPSSLANVGIIHDISESDFTQISGCLQTIRNDVSRRVLSAVQRLESLERELTNLAVQIDRAPVDDVIQGFLDQIKSEQTVIATLRERKKVITEELRSHILKLQHSTRKAIKLESQLREQGQLSDNARMAESSRELLRKLSQISKEKKIKKLEANFEEAFSRLARKEDMLIKAIIDPDTFQVKLVGKNGQVLQKKKLSAGEKQVFAIAMLEALALTSGRRLPVIIDTPLGRLDSKHRKSLVENYFPRASHQVIILSTDTEVDEKFYAALSSDVSHGYLIDYNEKDSASRLVEGYFWKAGKKELSYAS